jgi:hypothetical protein
MDLEQLFALLRRIYVWLPTNNPMRAEVQKIMDQIKAQRR